MSIDNALTFDVEDWHQLIEWRLTGSMPASCSPHVVPQTADILDTLGRLGVKGTFFVLAAIARQYPRLVRRIHEEGHEVASHGWSHFRVYTQTRAEFGRETRDARSLLEDTIGSHVRGYRAAEFSITSASRWALDVLAELGFEYDSSIFPIRGARYGMPHAPLEPFLVRTDAGMITEVPMTALDWAGRRWPVGGGGYFRLLPYSLTRRAIERVNRAGRPAVTYFHSYEFSTRRLTLDLPPWQQYVSGGRFTLFHNFNRGANRHRFGRLLRDFRFRPIAEILQDGCPNQAVL
jgi:polysaccharide deacetylase family protein (PEP-CTERM system associated)